MNLKSLLTHLLRADSQTFGDPTKDSEKVGSNTGVTAPSRRTTCEAGGGVEDGDNGPSGVNSDGQLHATQRGPHHIFPKILSSVFPSQNGEEEVQVHTRILPILSGVTIPFCILLDIPGLTENWHIPFYGTTEAAKPNPPLLEVAIALSLLCGVLANICLVIRFLERRVKTMTILSIVFLSMHDIIKIVVLATFGETKDDYAFSQVYWIILCSTIVSMFTNVTLIVDLIRTPDFAKNGSGLTQKQRSLVIIIIGLFSYIMLGALVNSLLLKRTFIDGLYFTVVSVETIGFGDIVPSSTSSRIFTYFYVPLGVINLAFVVGYVRETVLEGLDLGYRRRLLAIQERRQAARRRRRGEKRWRNAIIWRLREQRAPIWISFDDRKSFWSALTSRFRHAEWGIPSTAWKNTQQSYGQYGTQLNLWALPPCQLEAAALETGFALDTFLPSNFYDTYAPEPCHHAAGVQHHVSPSWFTAQPVYRRDEHATLPLTHCRLGTMAAMFTKINLAVYESGGDSFPNGHGTQNASSPRLREVDSSGSLQSKDGSDYRADVEATEKKAYYVRSGLSVLLLLIFWMGGAAIFRATEGWAYGLAVYFCFVSLTTIGYGDFAPTTPAGRSIFVVWALIGVPTMTIFISVVSEAYTVRYKNIFIRDSFRHDVRQCRERDKVQHASRSSSADSKVVSHEREKTNVVEDGLQFASTETADSTSLAVACTAKPVSQAQHTQPSLRKLPAQVLSETQSIRQYMQLMEALDEKSVEAVNGAVSSLINDVMNGRTLTEDAKKDILKDAESRQTLMLLGITRSLRELVNISETAAIAAIQERDWITAKLEQLEAKK